MRNKGKVKITAALSGSFLFLCDVEAKRKILRFYEIFGKIAKCGVVRIKGKFTQINVHFALRGVVGIRGRNFSAALAESPPRPSRVSENSMRNFRRNAINQPQKAG